MDRETLRRAARAAGALLGLGAALCVVALVWKPPCMILSLTGFFCPGCGGQRMVWAVLRGDWQGALRQNPLLFFLLPLAAVYALAEAARYVRGKRPLCRARYSPAALLALLALTLLFTVFRNLPGFSWLGPAP